MSEENNDYARTSPASLCILYLDQAAQEMEAALEDPQRWFFALPETHRAINCALVAVLSGSAGFGAYGPKARRKWIEYYNNPNYEEISPPSEQRVQSFSDLLVRAQDPTEPDLGGRPLEMSAEQLRDLARLTAFRDDMEHVKPRGWSIETGGLPRILRAGADALSQLIENRGPFMVLDEAEVERAHTAIGTIRVIADRYRSATRQG